MLWVAVSPDEIELPLAVEESATKLATKMKTTRSNILSKKSRVIKEKSVDIRS